MKQLNNYIIEKLRISSEKYVIAIIDGDDDAFSDTYEKLIKMYGEEDNVVPENEEDPDIFFIPQADIKSLSKDIIDNISLYEIPNNLDRSEVETKYLDGDISFDEFKPLDKSKFI